MFSFPLFPSLNFFENGLSNTQETLSLPLYKRLSLLQAHPLLWLLALLLNFIVYIPQTRTNSFFCSPPSYLKVTWNKIFLKSFISETMTLSQKVQSLVVWKKTFHGLSFTSIKSETSGAPDATLTSWIDNIVFSSIFHYTFIYSLRHKVILK